LFFLDRRVKMMKQIFLINLVSSSCMLLLSVMRWFSGYEFALIHFLVGLVGAAGLMWCAITSSDFVHVDDLFEDSEEVEEK
jgi:hypothetical protein